MNHLEQITHNWCSPINLINKSGDADTVPQRYDKRLQSRVAQAQVIKLPQGLDVGELVASELLVAERLVIRNQAPTKDVVRDDEGTRSEQPICAAGLRPL